MRTKPSSCVGCQLHSHGTDFSAVEGSGSNGVLIVGEASGAHEQRDQLPFRAFAPAGGVLERAIRSLGMVRNAFALTNVVRCRPRKDWLSGSPWEYSAIRQCRPNLDQAIASYRPRCILALGNIPMRELTGMSGVAEEAQSISHIGGYVLPLAGAATSIPVLSTFHPSFLRRGKMSHFGVLMRAINRATRIASGQDRDWLRNVDPSQPSTWQGLRYITHPSLDQVNSLYLYLKDNPDLYISKDIETPESASMDEDAREGFRDTEVRQIQFACGKGTGMAIQWNDLAQREIAIKILNLPNHYYGHNWASYDRRVLRAASAREGWSYDASLTVFDTLDMFHHWQPDLPAHLQFASLFVEFPFPWKHLHTIEFEPFYGACDVDATWRLGEFCRAKLNEEGIWGDHIRGYLGQLYEVRPVLAAMEDRGVPIDNEARLKLGGEFDLAQKELGQVINSLAPESCRRLHPKDGYKGVPPWVKSYCKDNGVDDLYAANVIEGIKQQDPPTKKDDKEIPGEFYTYQHRTFQLPAEVDGQPALAPVERWCRVYDFNPNSSQQVKEYMKSNGHPIPKDKHREDAEGNNPDTTGKKELVRLAKKTGDTFYLKVIEYREFSKLKGTYIDGFAPQADDRVHTTFTFDTGIGQTTSRNPNIQNFIKHGRLAHVTRGIVAADPSCILTEWDFKSCHVLTLGFLSEDANYIRCARLDMHSIMTGHFLKLWDTPTILATETDQQILDRCKWLKSNPEYKHIRDSKVKHAGLGIGNGLKERGLFERYMEFFANQKEAGKILAAYESVFPKVFSYQVAQVQEAHEKRILKTPFLHIRRFYEAKRPDLKRGGWIHGDQAEEAVAYRLANIAFGHIRENLKALYRSGLAAKYGLFNNIHDSFLMMFPEHMLEEHVREIFPVLTAPSTVLKHPTICPNGLVIGVDAAWGYKWNAMQEIKLPKLNLQEEPDALVPTQTRHLATAQLGASR
jgi:uracil-DNA glycosylase family 4